MISVGGVLHKHTVLNICIPILEEFAAANYLKHLNVRSEEKSHLCTVCGKSFFSQLNVLKLHQKRHIDVKNHVCFKCEKTFGTDAEMKRHQRIHIVKDS